MQYLYKNTIAVVQLMLNDLGGEASQRLDMGAKAFILIAYTNHVGPLHGSNTCQGKATLLRGVFALLLEQLRIQHQPDLLFLYKHDDPLSVTDHVGCHTHTFMQMGIQCIPQIHGHIDVHWPGRL